MYMAAARMGDLNMLQWLYSQGSQGCPCDKDTFETAAKNGHLEVLQWLHIKVRDVPGTIHCMLFYWATKSENLHIMLVAGYFRPNRL